MPVLKTPCPECGASMRFTVDGEGEHDVTCLKCGHDFTAALEPADPPKAKPGAGTKATAKVAKAKPARDDEDDDTPKKKKKKKGAAADDGRKKLILGAAVAGVLLLGGIGAAVVAFGGKDKKPAETVQAPAPEAQPAANPDPQPNPNPPPVVKPPVVPPKPKDQPVPPKPKGEDTDLATKLPPPPRIRVTGSLVPATKPLVKAPAIPPLAPDEDPFVRAAAFAPDGPLPTLPKLPATGRPLLTLDSSGHTGIVGKVFFTPKGDRVVTVGEDKAVRIWDPESNETVKTVRFPAGPGKEGTLLAAAMSRSGKRLAVAGIPLAAVQPGKVPIYLISPDTGVQLARLDVGAAAVTGLHFSNDGNWLGVGCENGAIQVVNVATGAAFAAPPVTKSAILEVRYNPNPKAKLLATLGADKYVQIWNFANVAQHKDFPIAGATPTALAWSNDGLTLAVGTAGGEIMLGTHDGKFRKALPKLTHGGKPLHVHQLQFLPGDGEIAVVGVAPGTGGWAGIVNADTGAARVNVTAHTNSVFALDVSADGQKIVTSGGNQHETLVWQAADGGVKHRLQGTGYGVWAVAWAKDGKSLAFGNNNKREAPGSPLPLEATFRLDEFGVGDPPDPSKYTQTVDSDEHVKLRTGGNGFIVQTTGREPKQVVLRGERVYSASVLPKGNAILVGGIESLYLMNPVTLEVSQTFVGHTGNVLCVSPSPDSRYFATGSADQTIRIWQRNHEEPVLSIFVAGREWIAWTPQGFYACSAQGERLIAWQVASSAVKFPHVYPAERFRPSMYQPALLKYLIPAGNLPLAMAMAKKYDKALVETASVADVLPPEVALDGFTDAEMKLDKDKDKLTVRATAKSPKHPITALRLLVDGRPFHGTDGVKRFADLQLTAEGTWEVPLAPGTHTFAVVADSAVSKGMSKVGVAVRPGEPPKPNLYVLAMGVSAYPKGINPLTYCASDAEMLAKAFQEKSKGVFAKIEVKVVTDKAATKAGIRAGLDWLKGKMTAQDVGVVSFSGHGTRDPFGRFYLVPSDVDPADEDGATSLSGDEFKARLDNMPGRLVAILDACHSGTVADKDRPPARADNLVRDLTATDSGVIVMCASLGREYAIESKVSKAGFFTLGLVEGLSGYADIDGDGVVYIHELDIYATARVRQLSGGRQNPTLGRPPTIKPFAMAKPDKPIAP